MKLLLLLFILSPVVLFGQLRRADIVDSVKANPNDLGAVSGIISKNQRTRVEHIGAADSGEYVNITVRVRVIEPLEIAAISFLPVADMLTEATVAGTAQLLTVPHMPYVRIEIEALTMRLVVPFATELAAARAVDPKPIPPIPYIPDVDVQAVPLYAIKQFALPAIMATKVNTARIPPMPDFPLDEIPVIEGAELARVKKPFVKMDTLVVPDFQEKKYPVEEMHLSPEGYSLLEKLEGFSPNLYALKDGGLTIGFGFFVPYGEGNKWRKGLTWAEADSIMRIKVPQYEDQVKKYINVPLTQNQFDALTMIAYNLGGFAKATSIVNDINNEADYEQLQKDWMRFVHSKAPGVMKGLMNRRKDELKVRNESDYQPERQIQILKNIK